MVKELARGEGWSFWQIGNEVFRARTGEALDIYGHPMAKRWECSLSHWLHFRTVFSWVVDL